MADRNGIQDPTETPNEPLEESKLDLEAIQRAVDEQKAEVKAEEVANLKADPEFRKMAEYGKRLEPVEVKIAKIRQKYRELGGMFQTGWDPNTVEGKKVSELHDELSKCLQDKERLAFERHCRLPAPATASGPDEAKTLASVRFSQKTPATNFSTLAGLIGATTVEAIFDPYLDNSALENLLILVTLGVCISPTCRILTSSTGAKKLSPAYVASWLTETKCTTPPRKVTTPKPHRRFMLLNNGQTLIIGQSLNGLGKDEAGHLEKNPADLAFFDTEWQSAVPV